MLSQSCLWTSALGGAMDKLGGFMMAEGEAEGYDYEGEGEGEGEGGKEGRKKLRKTTFLRKTVQSHRTKIQTSRTTKKTLRDKKDLVLRKKESEEEVDENGEPINGDFVDSSD